MINDSDLVNIKKYERFNSENDNILQSENYFNFVSKELVDRITETSRTASNY
jgi:hypothetical protein